VWTKKNAESFAMGEHIQLKPLAAVHNDVSSTAKRGCYVHQHKYGTSLVLLSSQKLNTIIHKQ
jgi:hypothetical protein